MSKSLDIAMRTVQVVCGLLLLSSAVALNKFIEKYVPLNYSTAHAEKELAERSTEFAEPTSKIPLRIRFTAYNRFFHLVLRPISPDVLPFAEDFTVFVDGLYHIVRPNLFLYQGYVKGDKKSLVYGSLFDGIFDGHIYLSDGNSFTVEKVSKYYSAHERNASFHSVIYYDNEKHMTSLKPQPVNLYSSFSYGEESLADFAARRARRYILDKDSMGRFNVRTCSMHLHADHKLYQEIQQREGNGDPARAIEEIVSMFYMHLRAVNEIYEPIDFDGVQGINFSIMKISIYTPLQCEMQSGFCKDHTDIAEYLTEFSLRDHSSFCLSYIMTYTEGPIGLAAGASLQSAVPTGLCAPYALSKFEDGRFRYKSGNVGVVNMRSDDGNRHPVQLSELALAHEIGHSLGSRHDLMEDDESAEGFYLMALATFPEPRSRPNHSKLSPESIASIAAVLDTVLKLSNAGSTHLNRSYLQKGGKVRDGIVFNDTRLLNLMTVNFSISC